jgi:hypothetical protein
MDDIAIEVFKEYGLNLNAGWNFGFLFGYLEDPTIIIEPMPEPPSFVIEDFTNGQSTENLIKHFTRLKNLFTTSSPADGWNKVIVDVPLPEEPIFTELVATKNGTYENPIIEEPPIVEEGALMQFRESIVLSSETISYLKSFNSTLLYKSGKESTH